MMLPAATREATRLPRQARSATRPTTPRTSGHDEHGHGGPSSPSGVGESAAGELRDQEQAGDDQAGLLLAGDRRRPDGWRWWMRWTWCLPRRVWFDDPPAVRPAPTPLPRASCLPSLPWPAPDGKDFFPGTRHPSAAMMGGTTGRSASCSPTTTRSSAAVWRRCSAPSTSSRWSARPSDGEAAVREAQLTEPDVVLMDVRMPGIDGVEATRRIRKAVPETAVLVLTMYDEDATVFTAMQAGAQRLPAQGRRAGGDRRRDPGGRRAARRSSGRASPPGCSTTSPTRRSWSGRGRRSPS